MRPEEDHAHVRRPVDLVAGSDRRRRQPTQSAAIGIDDVESATGAGPAVVALLEEDEPLVGYFPRKDRGTGTQTDTLRDDDFSVDLEIADCQRIIDQVKSRADDRAHVSEFRDKGAARLKDEGRDADDERTLKIAVQRERKMWVAEKLTDLGMERAQHWGWPNTYTYTKSLGDQVCAAAKDVRACIVRPAIVESAVRYPFEGWNEGFTTSSPLAFLTIKGHRTYPAGDKATLESFLYTKDAHPMALEFYKMMQTEGAGTAKISKIELVDLTPEDVKKASEVQTGPDGSKTQLPLKPTKKLKISIETKSADGSSSSSSESFVAEKDGKYVIPVPAKAK